MSTQHRPASRRATGSFLRAALATAILLITLAAHGQEQIDKPDPTGQRKGAEELTIRVRVTRCLPEAPQLLVRWRRGGEGLGGEVIRGEFRPEKGEGETIAPAQWSAPLPLETVVGRGDRWEFPSITVEYPGTGPKRQKLDPPAEIAVEFEFAARGEVFKRFVETSPRGATVGFAFPGGLLRERGAADAAFRSALQGLSGHARTRREQLEKALGGPAAPPKHFAVIGHLAGYGQGPGSGIGKAIGYKVRHCNPQIVADECRTLELLGINGMVGLESLELADAAGFGAHFRHLYWGGPGSGAPINALVKSNDPTEPCPFDPRLKETMAAGVARAIDEHKTAAARASWGIWWDEIGVAAKAHLSECPRCREQFAAYVERHGVEPAALGQHSWDQLAPYPLWVDKPGRDGKPVPTLTPGPAEAPEALRYYWTYRFMTFATGNLFPESAAALQQAGIRLYAMQGPTPSWNGSSLDWHEFYDLGANRAVVFETSNRDPRAWQWESYLSDIVRGIAARHKLPIGCLVKPHRGAASQRMLTVVARGAEAVEWYTYGPDYAKGDSFSQSPELLEEVGRAGRFLAKAEEHLYGARWAGRPEVAFVSPRSSEIWGKATDRGITAFEDAKWVYLALAHAQVPVAILSEQQLAEGALKEFKVLYLVGPNLNRGAAQRVAAWVADGGLLWTDCLGMAFDEANQPSRSSEALFGPGERKAECWGTTPEYRATTFQAFKESDAQPQGRLSWDAATVGKGEAQAWIGRELIASHGGEVLARFADDRPAVVRRRVGKGQVVQAGFWAGLTYSASVRREDYDMTRDFDAALRALIAAPALERGVYRPVAASEPLVEAVLLEKDGRRTVALMNWAYRRDAESRTKRGEALVPAEALRITLHNCGPVRAIRSLQCGPLDVTARGDVKQVVLPRLDAIDLLVIE